MKDDVICTISSRLAASGSEEKRLFMRTFEISSHEEHDQFRTFVKEFEDHDHHYDKKHFVYLWIMRLLYQQFFVRYLPLGFTTAEEAMIHEVKSSLEENDSTQGKYSS